ncbi:YciI family protein [Dyadobacter chenwenxiniae]|uniref:YciI family protein n=1 Tax=Dyadobacter chenwenxiniae TaxID=2906456 RepID=A0A9X1PPP9_9BACT|nr:YciI family protein [Dyadobacter chenwenxiniae]MCF0065227.1 YciI family protein [Dyadobacter chenwenxiniae]UON84503.1 YciI family protein [Dyadobacter chenwenxiniae]
MKRFLLLIREDISRLAQMSEEEMQQDIAEMNGWVEELVRFDNFVSGEPLENEGQTIGKPVATDGPFIDSKEGISGYMIIQAENLEQAAAIAAQCPHIVQGKISIEVRPIMEISQES